MPVLQTVRQWFGAINRTVFITAVAAGGRVNALTMTQVMQANYGEDPWLLLSVAQGHFSYDLIRSARLVAVHYVTADETAASLAEHLGTVSGRNPEKMAGIPYTLSPEGVPLLDHLPYHAVLRVKAEWETPPHTIFGGSILRCTPPPPGAPLLDVATLMRRPRLAAQASVWDREG